MIASLYGEDSRCIDLPNGGNVTVYGNVIEKGPESSNGQVINEEMTKSLLIKAYYNVGRWICHGS